MSTWCRFILNALFPKKKVDTGSEMTDKDDDVISNYIELDSLMQVIYHTNKEAEAGS